MRRELLMLAVAVLLCTLPGRCATPEAAQQPPVTMADCRAGVFPDATGALPSGLPFRLFVPKNYNRHQRYPLVLALHGAGERGVDNVRQGANGLLSWAQPAVQEKYPCFVLLPQCPQSLGTFQLLNMPNRYPTGDYDFAVAPAQATAGTPMRIPVGRYLRGRKQTLLLCAQPQAKDGTVEFIIRNLRFARRGRGAGTPVNLAGQRLRPLQESFVYDVNGCYIAFADAPQGTAVESSIEADGSLHVKSTGRQLRLGIDFPCNIERDSVLTCELTAITPGYDNRIGLIANDRVPEYRWVNTDWSLPTAQALPQTPSAPMRLALGLLDAVRKDWRIDPNRIYVTGLSMGGYGTYDIIARRPQLFAAAIPMCGGGDPATAPTLTHLPLWIFHGGADPTVPTQRSRMMVEALHQAGGAPRYTEYPGVGHASWINAYQEPELADWLFTQVKH